MEHTGCGAVSATVDHVFDSDEEPIEVVSLLHRIEPAVADLPEKSSCTERINLAVKKNVQLAVQQLSDVADLEARADAGRIRIVGAVYDMHSGKVDILP